MCLYVYECVCMPRKKRSVFSQKGCELRHNMTPSDKLVLAKLSLKNKTASCMLRGTEIHGKIKSRKYGNTRD